MERKTNLTLPSHVWVWGETAKRPNAAERETVAAFLCLFGMSERKRKIIFCSGCTSLMKHRGSTLEGKCGRSCTIGGGGVHQVKGYEAAQSVCDATTSWV